MTLFGRQIFRIRLSDTFFHKIMIHHTQSPIDSSDAHDLTHWMRNEMYIRPTSRIIPEVTLIEVTFIFEGFDTTLLVRRNLD